MEPTQEEKKGASVFTRNVRGSGVGRVNAKSDPIFGSDEPQPAKWVLTHRKNS